jgi:hypothetical protein
MIAGHRLNQDGRVRGKQTWHERQKNLRPQLLPLSRTRPPAERNCPTNASRALLLNSFQLIPTGASFTCSSVACFPHLSPKGGSINEKQWRQSSGHKKPHGHFRKPMAGGVPIAQRGGTLGWGISNRDPQPVRRTTDRPCGKVPRRGWGSGRGFSRWDGGANPTTMIPRHADS